MRKVCMWVAVLPLIMLLGCENHQDKKRAEVTQSPVATTTPAPAVRSPAVAGGEKSLLAPTAQLPVAKPAIVSPSPTEGPASAAVPIPTTLPGRSAGDIPAFAREQYRLVYGEDEIVSVLQNGAVVIAKRVVGSPVLAVRGYVQTGAINEGRWLGGGLSHLLEHLVAGGSNERRDEAQGRELLQQIGNNSNAYTTSDHIAYFINTTPENLAKAVDLLTGWMLHAKITEEEFRREYQVVQRELEMGRGEPGRQFYLLSQMNRYRISPVRVPVIGYPEVIQALKRDDVYTYYKLAYVPNNMVFAIAGDLDPEQMLATFQRYIDVPTGRVVDRTVTPEPEVTTPRTSVFTMPKIGEARVSLQFPSIELDDPDLYALDLLAAVVGQSESSPLVREVRDKQLASSIVAYSFTPDYVQGSFGVQYQTKPDQLDASLEAVQLVLDRVKREPFPDDAVQRAKTQLRVSHLRELQETENVAATMAGDYMSTGDVHFSKKYLDRIAAVTPADIQAVARKYLDSSRLVKTVMLPEEAVGEKGLPAAAEVMREVGTRATTARVSSTQRSLEVQRTVLDNGTILLVRRVPSSPLIAVRMYADGGLTAENESVSGIGNLTMSMLMRGTTFRSANQLAEQLENMGASVSGACGNNTWYWSGSMLADDFEKAMDIFADVVKNPSFAQGELDTMRKRVLAAIAAQDADWSGQAMRFFRRQYFPQTSPYHMELIGQEPTVSAFTAQQLRDWYQQHVLASRRVLAIYGDIDVERAQKVAADLLGGGPKLPTDAPPAAKSVAVNVTDPQPQITVRDVKVQPTKQPLAGVLIGFDSASIIGEPAFEQLAVADTVTSGWGYPTGYLHETLRGEGLVYVVQAQNLPGRSAKTPGTFFVFAGCEPQRVNEVVDRILLNMARIQGTPHDIQEDWFVRACQLLITDDAMSMETVGDQASGAALDELYGMGYDFHKGFKDRVAKVQIGDLQNIARQRLRTCLVAISTPRPDLVTVKPETHKYDSFPEITLTPRGVEHDMPVGR